MSDLTVTATQVKEVYTDETVRRRNGIAGVAVTGGQSVYRSTDGKYYLCDANDSGKEQFRGIVLYPGGGAGQAITVLEDGEVYGYDLSGLNPDALVYQSDTAGALATAASGTKTVVVGRVTCLSDANLTKVLRVGVSWLTTW